MKPILMRPAFRHGADTPWGGDALRTVFKKPIPDGRTGESLEISALPGLCSRDEYGRPLNELIKTGGETLLGSVPGTPFPLLVKLIHARERLSVQVHPDDAYAAANENGKLGKSEAWVVLRAEEGAKLVHGVKPGVSKRDLERASAAGGAALEDCLRWLSVSEGDVLFIPPGTVHAIGEGILLYEIQQSSDLTYRFWDWNRLGADGAPRPLHIKKALDVTDAESRPGKITAGDGRSAGVPRRRLIRGESFALDRLDSPGTMRLPESRHCFGLLTALCGGRIDTADGSVSFRAGDSMLLPASAGDAELRCEGTLLLAAPFLP